jgi:diguanylate cyclase (GGDEF)-like protein
MHMTNILERIQPPLLLRAQVVAVVATATIAVAVFLLALSFVNERLSDSSDKTAAALLAFRVHDELSHSLDILSDRVRASTEDLEPAARQTMRDALLGEVLPAALLDVRVPMSLREAATLQGTYDALVLDARSLAAESAQPRNQALLREIESLQIPLHRYLNEPSGLNFHRLFIAVSTVEGHARQAIPDLVGEANDEDTDLRDSVEEGGYAMLAGVVVFAAGLVLLTVVVSQRVRALYAAMAAEQEHLRTTTTDLQLRNEQMNGLYSVFTEITDTLSIGYVVNATLREAIRLMHCHTAVLRLLKDGQLVLAGSLNYLGEQIPNLETRPLMDDPLGRVAKRGKPMRIGEHNKDLLFQLQQGDEHIQSGLIIPLILGARVVGTLSVWSYRPDDFNDEDERILTMMGSQVATAVVAADTTEASEHRAQHDPLTGLPNRLRLMEDMAKDFSLLRMGDRSAVVAMVDIDHFKRFNDDFGHAVGDVSLQKVAVTMRQSLRPEDRVYRYGGEEFVVVFMDVNAEAGEMLAERLRAAIEMTPLTGDQLEPVGPVTISMGLAVYPDDGKEFGSLIEMADLAMYRAKALGRNQVATWRKHVVTAAA